MSEISNDLILAHIDAVGGRPHHQYGGAVLDCFVAPSGRLAMTPLMQFDREML